ncbi:unnamed protein product [Adineta ricciae]|uniref:Uncharacterized protein n=1 Tax=Adineta ricciae TaxID=249248 RepID=A0A815FRJ5_ADIRI|nr:unnamed protein product [Adineta ricciae]CAF1327266.1 unnamed protein product [Adineta ricciae]
MHLRSIFLAPFRLLIYLFIISSLFLLQTSRPIQAISLSRLCGSFGHSCFGANWGKRSSSDETSTRYIRLNLNDNDEARPVPAAGEDDILKEFRAKLLRQRLRQSASLDYDRIRRSLH